MKDMQKLCKEMEQINRHAKTKSEDFNFKYEQLSEEGNKLKKENRALDDQFNEVMKKLGI